MNLAVNARDAMPKGGKLTIETAQRRAGRDLRAEPSRRSARARTCCWPSATPAAAWTRRRRRASSSRSSPPRRRARAPAWAWRPSTASSSRAAATSRSTASRARARPSRSTCRACEERPSVRQVADPALAGAPGHGDGPAGGGRGRRAVARPASSSRCAGYTRAGGADGERGAGRRPTQHQGPIHLLVTDVVMPEMSGRAAGRAAGRTCSPEMKVLFMSGYTDDAVVRHGVLDADGRLPAEAVHARARWPARSARCWTAPA